MSSLALNQQKKEYALPKNYEGAIVEPKWQKKWEEWTINAFDKDDRLVPTYSIDTPPPYPSGEFHMGNALNWCYFDFVARYKRMRGYNVLFPQGWDCHGLPTEVRVETVHKIRKNSVPLIQFKELCVKMTREYIDKMKRTMMALGFSIDWTLEYETMDPNFYRVTQLSFILLYNSGYIYRAEHPVNWCPRCETAIAEAEVEYGDRETSLNFIRFTADGKELLIATTRPELLPACVAVAVNPTDNRYRNLHGKRTRVPVFHHEVPIITDEGVDPQFGTGVVMICTFGDKTDVRWQKQHNLPVVKAISEDGRMTEEARHLKGLTIAESRNAILEQLQKEGLLYKREPLKQNVGSCWRCHTPAEIISRVQWFMKTKQMTEDVVSWAERVEWIPDFAKHRLIEWARSLDWDWVISRQRVFATPIPVWFCKNCGQILLAQEDWLPVDPRFEKPRGTKCRKCGSTEFTSENDVMDTWMDSSTTCAYHAGWPGNEAMFQRLFPADLQPNGLDIIRTWDYYLMVKHLALFEKAPYKTVLVNGMVRGADGRMMHKSYGNYVEAGEAIGKYGADAIRQWAASGGTTGSDIPFRWEDVEYGRKFITKLWNSARFVLSHVSDFDKESDPEALEDVDKWLLSKLEKLTDTVTRSYEAYQFSNAIDTVREFTWHVFCDHYLEAVKYRLYDGETIPPLSRKAAQTALLRSLMRILLLLAPVCPHVTEEIFQVIPDSMRAAQSLHKMPWPKVDMHRISEKLERDLDVVIEVLAKVRTIKSERKLSLKTELSRIVIHGGHRYLSAIERSKWIIMRTCNCRQVEISDSTPPEGAKTLSTDPSVSVSI